MLPDVPAKPLMRMQVPSFIVIFYAVSSLKARGEELLGCRA